MTKQDLQEIYWLNKNISKLEEKIAALRASVTGQAACLSGMPGSGGNRDKIAGAAAEIDKSRGSMELLVARMHKVASKIELAIAELPQREQYLVRARYLELQTWEQIAVDMCYSWRQIHRLHSNALQKLAQNGTP